MGIIMEVILRVNTCATEPVTRLFITETELIGKSKWVKGKYQGFSSAFCFAHRFDM